MSRCRSISRLMTCAWIDTSSAETGSSPMMSFGIERQRAGDADALALAAGELVRVVVHLRPAQADAVEQLPPPARAAPSCAAMPCTLQRLADDVAGAHARVERGERVLEDDLHLPAEGPQLAPCRAG